MSHSKIFQRNRALGYVSNHVPLVTRYIQRRKENLIVTCVGRSFHTYGCSHFTLLSVSGVHSGDITCLASDTYHVYTACENDIFAWRRGCELKHTYKGHEAPVHLLLPFGAHLLSIDEQSHLKIWDIKAEEITLELDFNNDIFKIVVMMHPVTYLNKILLGSEQGQMQLWNVRTSKLIYTFQGWNCGISVIEQAPAIDVVAVGLTDGRIILHNLRYDRTVFELVQDWGLVTSISFRTDDHPIMVTGSLQGHVVIWNLEERKVESQILSAHFGAVTGMQCLPNEPLLVTSSPDNSLKLWIFDQADGSGRLLRIREGHAEPPKYIRFYGNDGNNILTAGGDSSLRIFSTITETFNKSLGRASFNRKASKRKGRLVEDHLIMPPMTEIASEITREKDWDNIVASHEGLGIVTTWSYDKLKMGEHKLIPESLKQENNVTATCLCLTQCGNFVVIGYNTGHVERFNIQSGIHRASYGNEKRTHKGPVKGVAVDSLNLTIVTAGRDAKVKFWHFNPKKGKQPKSVLKLEDSVEWLRTHRESSLIALALQDFTFILIDIDTKNIVRRFQGHTGRLMDATFSPDSRWLVTTSLDRTIRTWDIPSAQLIDVFQVTEACISLHFSPTGEYLVTAHVCNLGLYLWSNRTLFSHVSLKAVRDNEPILQISLPGTVMKIKEGPKVEEMDVESEDEDNYESPEQLNSELITMSSVASSRWMNLLNIDLVKKRNKPKDAPKQPEAAPFFLPTIPDLQTRFDFSDVQKEDKNQKILTHPNFQSLSIIGQMIHESIETDNFDKIIINMKTMGPSAIDFQIQSLALDLNLSTPLMLQFLKMIKFMMESKKDFELAQAYLSLFLKVHGNAIAQTKDLREYLDELKNAQSENWALLKNKLFYNLSVVQHLRRTL